MLSVIQPSSNLGAFPSYSHVSGEARGYSQSPGSQLYNVYNDKKWPLPAQQSPWAGMAASTSSYLFGSSPYSSHNDFHRRSVYIPSSGSGSVQDSNVYHGCYPPQLAVEESSRARRDPPPTPKDYFKPLFVDCSIEYELPNAPKVPKNSEPILMIHPAYRAIKRGKRTLSKPQKPSSNNPALKPLPKVPLNSMPNTTGITDAPFITGRSGKRSYCQMSSDYMSLPPESYISLHPQCIPYSVSSSFESCYPSYSYQGMSPKRCCRRAPQDLATFRRQQHLMHLQAQFSLYLRGQEGGSVSGAFWT